MWNYLIIGGVIGRLTIAQKLHRNNKNSTIFVLEKESYSGFDGNGINCGVLYS